MLTAPRQSLLKAMDVLKITVGLISLRLELYVHILFRKIHRKKQQNHTKLASKKSEDNHSWLTQRSVKGQDRVRQLRQGSQ